MPQPGAMAPAAAEAIHSLAGSLVQAERDLILDALRNHQGSRREAAERLGISPRTLRYKLARLREAGVDVPAA
jgi:two-component system response regulator FlrC